MSNRELSDLPHPTAAKSHDVPLVTRSDDGYVAITLRVMSGTSRDPAYVPRCRVLQLETAPG